MIKLVSLLLLFTFSLNANVIINNEIKKYDNFNIQYLYDETSSLTIQTIQNKEFTQTINSQFTQGYKYGDAWFKFEFTNNTANENFVLNFTEQIWSTLNLYSKQNLEWTVQKNGLNIPLIERGVINSTPSFHIKVLQGETATFYVKGNTIASQIGEFQLFTKKEFCNPSRITLLEWYMIYTFVLFAFILLNAYNFLVTKERIYAYYIAYVFVYIVFASMHSGIYITLGFPTWKEGLHVLGQLTLFTLLLFSIEFLELKRTYPLMKKAFNILAVISLFFALLLSQNIPYATVASNVFFSSVLITIVIVAIKVLRDGFNGAKYYLIALMLYLPSMAMMAMNFNTLLPNTDITRYSFLGGAFIEIFLFTLILTNRYMDVNRDRLNAQKHLLLEKQKNEEFLEHEIEKRTNDLKIANQNLTAQAIELEKTKELLTIEARTDVLSGLYNRRYFFEVSRNEFNVSNRYSQKLSIMLLDIDTFKKINDTYGHEAGDIVIQVFSSILQDSARDSDIVARYGGEEFIILMPNTTIEDAAILGERIRRNIENEVIDISETQNCKVTASIGVTQVNNMSDTNIEAAIKRCDVAMYKAKDSGRNKVISLL